MKKNIFLWSIAVGLTVASPSYAGTELENIIRDTAPTSKEGLRNVVVFQFNYLNALPQMDDSGKESELKIQNGWLVVINKASDPLNDNFGGDHQLHSRIFSTANEGCQRNPNAVADDGTRMTWSTYTPTAAIATLIGKGIVPSVIFNANYFDVRKQKGTSWQQSGCSLPLGIFYDSHDGAFKNDTVKDNPYRAGAGGYIKDDGELDALQTFIIADDVRDNGFGRRVKKVAFELVDNKDVNGNEAINVIKKYIDPKVNSTNEKLIALSGVGLLPKLNAGIISSSGPDSGDTATTRIGIAFNEKRDQLYIFSGGSYKDGITRKNLRAFFKALGANIALELDGGGSAAIAVNKDLVSWAGASWIAPDDGSCNVAGYICTPVTQPSGSARAVPSWAYINLERNYVIIDK